MREPLSARQCKASLVLEIRHVPMVVLLDGLFCVCCVLQFGLPSESRGARELHDVVAGVDVSNDCDDLGP